MLQWFESTSAATWVAQSTWGYPLMLALHVTGLACAAGLFIVASLVALGRIRGLEAMHFRSALRLGWYGFGLNLASGTLLFSSQATSFAANPAFLLKIVLIGIAAAATAHLHVGVASASGEPHRPPAASLNWTAMISLSSWSLAIVAGRLIAYS